MKTEKYLYQISSYNDHENGVVVPTHIDLHEIGQYPESSVLAGQMYDRVINTYVTMEQAMTDNPNVEIHYTTSGIRATVPDLAPQGFDPADCGERWYDDY